jgi:hypothetical protein
MPKTITILLRITFFFIGLAFITSSAYAEYYFSAYGCAPHYVELYGYPVHRRVPIRHISHYIHHSYHHYPIIEESRYCDQDLSTGDDNACVYPDMDIDE